MKQIKEYNPDELNSLCDESVALYSAGQYAQSLAVYESILSEFPENLRALHGIGVVLHKMGRSDGGIASIRKALDLKPDFASAYNNLGNIYYEELKYVAAEDCYQHLVKLEPDNDVAYKNLALALLKSGRLDEALNACVRALEIDPRQSENHMLMGDIYAGRGDAEQALRKYSSVFESAPCSSDAHTNILFTMNFLSRVTQLAIYRESRRWGKLHAAGRYIRRPHLNSPVPGRRLRIGYVSGDFKLHPVSYHLEPVVKYHDRENFEIYLYSNLYRFDEMTRKLKDFSDHWRNIESLSDEQVDEMIRLDGIDILVDLSGHTSLNRLLVFARKPAPVQVSWIGYFNTIGMLAIDYLISDAITVTPGEERWFCEQIVRLPDGRFCYEPPDYAPEVAPLPALSNGFITFGSFNKLTKITPETVLLWCSVLNSVPNSRLVLKTMALGTDSVRNHFLEQFKQNGVDANRIEVRKVSTHPQMLAEYGDIDIAFDTFPFNSGATTCEALWMGVPVVTMTCKTPISRQSTSLLASCGLAEMLSADSQTDFIHIVQNLATNIDALAELRASLRDRLSTSPLCDGALFSRNLEQAYRKIWHDWCRKQKKISLSRPHNAISAGEYYNAGINRMDEKDYSSAVPIFKLAIRKKPDFAEAHNNLGISLAALGKDFQQQAMKSLRKAIRINTSFGEAHNNLGRVLTEMGRYSQAVRTCRTATELMPGNPDAYLNLGNACREKGLFMEALASFEAAADLKPKAAAPLSLIAGLKLLNGDPAGAINYFKKARELQPDNPDIQSNILFAMNYVSTCSQKDIFEESCLWDSCYSGHLSGQGFSDRCEESGRLRVGYISADFHHHPVGIFFQAVARNHNQQNFEVFCYSNKRKDDEVEREIVKYVEHWRDIEGMPDDDLYALIQRDRINLLVDLSGHTGGNRLPLFSRRSAPVQMSWLGYFNTTGLANMDYVISDNDTVPPGCEQWYRETVIRMPDNRFCYTPPAICPDVESLPALKNGYVTFGCFNNIAKLTPEVIEVWSEILKKIPDSKLVLKWKTLNDGAIRDYYRMLFSMYGIPRRQIEFRGQSPLFIMRDEYNDIDIALDPFPFTGGITSCEALWMGIPVITLAGERPVSRQTKGFLNMIGLDELSSATISGYIDCAIQMSGDLERLAALRQGLRQRMASSPLCDGVRFTKKLEDIYCKIWQSWRDKVGAHTNRTSIND
ncbi:MAG TPA: tetratricopeptide repeat protein [Desulfuromonadaceae bacterium]|jgi:predicted O-linked N-acetylglucosamine transferase (SPINDLY family)